MKNKKITFWDGGLYRTRDGATALLAGRYSPSEAKRRDGRCLLFVVFNADDTVRHVGVHHADGRSEIGNPSPLDIVAIADGDALRGFIRAGKQDFPPSPSAGDNILREAESLMTGDRHADYGPAPEEFARVAKLWSVVLGAEITPRQAALCMVQLKLAREVHRHKRDNVVDAAAYLQIAADCEAEWLDSGDIVF